MNKALFALRAVAFGLAGAAALAGATAVAAATMGDDGLHKTGWMRDTFKDMREDLDEANALGLRLMVLVEQRGCIYCREMHEKVFPDPDITRMIEQNFFVVQLNMFGDVEVTDFDGTTLPEKDMVRRWNVMFTPTILYFPEEVPEDVTSAQAAAVVVPGAFGRGTTLNMANRGKGNCIACHQVGALSDQPFHGEVGPPLDGVADRWTEADLRGLVANAKMTFEGTVMPAFYKTSGFIRPGDGFTGKAATGEPDPLLTAQEVEDVVAYLLTLSEE